MKTYIIFSFFLILAVSCTKQKTEPDLSNAPLQINFLDSNGQKMNDTASYAPGGRILFKVDLKGKDGLVAIKYNFEVQGVIDEEISNVNLWRQKQHDFIMDYTVPSIYAGRTILFKFLVTDNTTKVVERHFVAKIASAPVDYIGYFTPKDVDTVYDNATYNYQYTFFSTFGVEFQTMEIKQSVNGGSPSLIATKLPAEVLNGAGASYKYWASYTPTFDPATTSIVETNYTVKGANDLMFSKTHTLIVINK